LATARQPAIAGDDDEADPFRLALDEERVLIFQVRVGQVPDHAQHLARIWSRRLHELLRLAHLAGGDHLHGLGDLLSVLNTLDLGADFALA